MWHPRTRRTAVGVQCTRWTRGLLTRFGRVQAQLLPAFLPAKPRTCAIGDLPVEGGRPVARCVVKRKRPLGPLPVDRVAAEARGRTRGKWRHGFDVLDDLGGLGRGILTGEPLVCCSIFLMTRVGGVKAGSVLRSGIAGRRLQIHGIVRKALLYCSEFSSDVSYREGQTPAGLTPPTDRPEVGKLATLWLTSRRRRIPAKTSPEANTRGAPSSARV